MGESVDRSLKENHNVFRVVAPLQGAALVATPTQSAPLARRLWALLFHAVGMLSRTESEPSSKPTKLFHTAAQGRGVFAERGIL